MRRTKFRGVKRSALPMGVGAVLLACSSSDEATNGASGGAGGDSMSTTEGSGGLVTAGAGGGTGAGSSGGGVTELPVGECEVTPTVVVPDAPPAPEPDPERSGARKFFRVHVRTGDGTPIRGATVKTVGKVVSTADDNGNVAFDEPGQVEQDVYFHVEHPGFEADADGFGYRGAALHVTEGGTGEIVMNATSGDQGPDRGDLATRLLSGDIPDRDDCIAVRVVDPSNGRGVPIVRLSAFGEDYWTDSQGMVAYCNPDHLGGTLSFDVMSHGYALPGDRASVEVEATAGGEVTIEVERELAAERLYRTTGSGIYRDSVLLGLTTPTKLPVLNGKVIGSDTVDTTIYKGEVFWLWQDTERVAYPLGNFSGTAATSTLPEDGGLPASVGVDQTYFVGDDGFAKAISEPFEPGGPVWMAGLISVPDEQNDEHLFVAFAKVSGVAAPLKLGMMKWNPSDEIFELILDDFLDRQNTDPKFVRPDGYAFKFTTGAGDEHVYYPARLRIPATAASLSDPATYETFTAFADTELQYLESGELDYAFRTNSLPTTSEALQNAGVANDQDLDRHYRSLSTGNPVDLIQTHSAYNPYRRRFLRQAQVMGDWGELHYVEGDTPMGPWVYTEKVITHDAYTFYNPSPHPEFDEGNGRFVFFEGTYTTFLQSTTPTPRYDYNQIMYRLDVDDDRVVLPVPIYDVSSDLPGDLMPKQGLRPGVGRIAAPMMAFDRPKQGAVAVRWSAASCSPGRRLVVSDTPAPGDLFYALPADSDAAHTMPLYEYTSSNGEYAYSVDASLADDSLTQSPDPLVRVYENPIQVPLPVGDFLGLVADAGEDQCITLTAGDTAPVEVSATAVGDTATAIHWKVVIDGTCYGAEGDRAQFDLPAGTHAIVVEIENTAGDKSYDTVLVTVSES